MSERRNLGRASEGLYPLLEKCPICRHVVPRNRERPELIVHWPHCPRAEAWQRDLWERRGELRALRTTQRLEP
jgi:hypothetical protein